MIFRAKKNFERKSSDGTEMASLEDTTVYILGSNEPQQCTAEKDKLGSPYNGRN